MVGGTYWMIIKLSGKQRLTRIFYEDLFPGGSIDQDWLAGIKFLVKNLEGNFAYK